MCIFSMLADFDVWLQLAAPPPVSTGLPPSASPDPGQVLVWFHGGRPNYPAIHPYHHNLSRWESNEHPVYLWSVQFVLSLPYSVSTCPSQWQDSGYTTPKYSTLAYWIFSVKAIWEVAYARRTSWHSPEAGRKTRIWGMPSLGFLGGKEHPISRYPEESE